MALRNFGWLVGQAFPFADVFLLIYILAFNPDLHCRLFQWSIDLISHMFFLCALQAADLTRPVDKRLYRGTSPTCHDFNSTTATSDRIYLVVGFSAGQVQLLDPIGKENSKLFNEEVCYLVESFA